MYFYLKHIMIFLLYSVILHAINKDKFIWWISLIQFASIAMFRGEHVGTDTYVYCGQYMRTVKIENIMQVFQTQLGGFSFFLWPLRQVLPYRWMWMILSGLIPTVCVWLFIKFHSPNLFLSIYLYITCYFYFQAMNAGRQAIAMGVSLLALSLIYRKQYLWSFLLMGIALMVHPGGSVIMLAAYPISFIRWTPKKYAIALAGSVIVGSFINIFEDIFIKLFPYYGRYSYSSWRSQGRMFWFYLFISVFVVYAYLVLNHICGSKYVIRNFMLKEINDKDNDIQNIWINMTLIMLQLVLCITLNKMVFINRATNVFMLIYILFIPQILVRKTKVRKSVTGIMVVGTFGYMVLRLAGNYGAVYPYYTFF